MHTAFLLQANGNALLQFLPIVAMFGIMYFLVLLPAQRQRKQLKEMLAGLKSGDEVVTSGGLIGTIFSINSEDESLVLRVKPDNLKIRVTRGSVAAVVTLKSGETQK